MLRMRYLAGAPISPTRAKSARSAMRGRRATDPIPAPPLSRVLALVLFLACGAAVLFYYVKMEETKWRATNTFKPLEEVKWGIIGCGDVTEKKSGPALQLIPHSSLVMVMRRNATLAEDYAKRHNVPRWTSSAEELVKDPEVNAIYVATPPLYHIKYALMAAAVGKAVYVEKPMGVSQAAGKMMVTEFHQRNLPLYVAYYRRALPNFLKVRELVTSGAIGTPQAVHVQYHRPPNKADLVWAASGGANLPSGSSLQTNLSRPLQWRTDPMVGGDGGYFRDKASHQLDLLEYWFGPIVSASGSSRNQGSLYPAEDTFVGTFVFSNGVVGTGSWCFVTGQSAHSEYGEIAGSSGRIRFQFFKSNKIELWNETGYSEIEIPNPKHVQQPLLETVVSALRGKGECPSTGESALRTNWVMDCIVHGISMSLASQL